MQKNENITPKPVEKKKKSFVGQTFRFAKTLGQGSTEDFLVIFFRQIAEMIHSGIPIYQALKIVGGQFENTRFKEVIDGVMYHLSQEGAPLHKSMSYFPQVFSPVRTATIRAGEQGGFLPEVLRKVADESEKDSNLKKRFYSIITYPIFIIVFSIIAMIIILKFILPSFAPLMNTLNVDAPMPTKILNAAVAVLNNPITILIVITLAVLFYLFVKTPKGGAAFQNLLLELPIIGSVMRYTVIVRFSRMYALLSDTGFPMVQSLQLISTSLGSYFYEKKINIIIKDVKEGDLLSRAFRKHKAFPRMLVSMITVGEESGDMKNSLQKLAHFYEIEIESTMNKFFSLLEPLLLIYLGLMVGFVVLSIFLPVYQIVTKMTG